MKNLLKVALGAAMLLSISAHAHDELISSTPGDGTLLTASPSQIKLTFSGEVRLISVELLSDSGDTQALDFTMSRTAQAAKEIPVADDLSAGTYTVEWRAMSSDSHRISGAFSFEVK